MRPLIALVFGIALAATPAFAQFATDAYGNANPYRKPHSRDDFAYLTEINKASLVMLRETKIVPEAVAARLAHGIDSVTEGNAKAGAERPRDYLKYEPQLIAAAGQDGSMLHVGRSRQDLASTATRMYLRETLLDADAKAFRPPSARASPYDFRQEARTLASLRSNSQVTVPGVCRSQLFRHEHAVRILHVVRERAAFAEPELCVEVAGRRKFGDRARFKTEPHIGTLAGFPEDVLQEARSDSCPEVRGGSAHRLDLSMRGIQLLERAAAQQLGVLPGGPEGNLRTAQAREVEGVHAFRRGKQGHAAQVFLEQFRDLGTAQVIEPYVHGSVAAPRAEGKEGTKRPRLVDCALERGPLEQPAPIGVHVRAVLAVGREGMGVEFHLECIGISTKSSGEARQSRTFEMKVAESIRSPLNPAWPPHP